MKFLIVFFLLLNNLNLIGSVKSNNRRKTVTFSGEDNIIEFSDHLFCEKYQKSTNFKEGSKRRPKRISRTDIKKSEKQVKSCLKQHSKNYIKEEKKQMSFKKIYVGLFFLSAIYLVYLFKVQSDFVSKNESFRIV